MTFEEKFALNNDMSHEEKYTAIVNGLGYENVKKFVPFSAAEIAKALAKKDKHLNTLPLSSWDRASGYRIITMQNRQDCIPTGMSLASYVMLQGINAFSLSELVCILKRCAVMEIEIAAEQ